MSDELFRWQFLRCIASGSLWDLEFCLTFDTENSFLREREQDINAKIKKNKPTIPTSLEEELKTKKITLKKMTDGSQESISLEDLINKLKNE